MESHSQTDDIITLSNDSQSGTQATSSSHLFVECPGICKRQVALEKVNLARESRSRAIWNCNTCRQIKKKQIKISWYDLVCVQCTHTHGKTCLIQNCTSNCPTKQALEKKKDLVAGKARAFPSSCPTKQALEKKKPVTSKVDRTFIRARSLIEPLMHRELVERLNVIKTAWILGKNGVPQPWFSFCGKAICDTPGWLSRCLGSAPKCTTKQSTT